MLPAQQQFGTIQDALTGELRLQDNAKLLLGQGGTQLLFDAQTLRRPFTEFRHVFEE